jgi:hypothetical protein
MAIRRRPLKAQKVPLARRTSGAAWLGFGVTALFFVYAILVAYGAVVAEEQDIQITGSMRDAWQELAAETFFEIRGSLHNLTVALLGGLWAVSLFGRQGVELTVPTACTFLCATISLTLSIYFYYRFSTHLLDSLYYGAFSPNSEFATAAWETQSILLIVGTIGTAAIVLTNVGERS